MAISNEKIEKISQVVIKVLYSRFQNFPKDSTENRNAPFHEAFLNAFNQSISNSIISDIPYLISINSWIHGLSTSLGMTYFEQVAHILCEGEKREYTSGRGTFGNLRLSQIQKSTISSIITDLSNGVKNPSLQIENDLIFQNNENLSTNADDFTADVFYETENDIIAIELKAVHPNGGEIKGEKTKILQGKAALHNIFPNKNIKFNIGFPYDPLSEGNTTYDKNRFMRSIINMGKYFTDDEVLLSEELWHMLSGEENTMQQLLDNINSIATSEFEQRFDFLANLENRNSNRELYI